MFIFADRELPGLGNEVGREQTWHLYYQWVAVVLLIQAFFFYIPWYLWNVWEGGRLEKLVKDLGEFPARYVYTGWSEAAILMRLCSYLRFVAFNDVNN